MSSPEIRITRRGPPPERVVGVDPLCLDRVDDPDQLIGRVPGEERGDPVVVVLPLLGRPYPVEGVIPRSRDLPVGWVVYRFPTEGFGAGVKTIEGLIDLTIRQGPGDLPVQRVILISSPRCRRPCRIGAIIDRQ